MAALVGTGGGIYMKHTVDCRSIVICLDFTLASILRETLSFLLRLYLTQENLQNYSFLSKGLSINYVDKNVGMKAARFSALAETLFSS